MNLKYQRKECMSVTMKDQFENEVIQKSSNKSENTPIVVQLNNVPMTNNTFFNHLNLPFWVFQTYLIIYRRGLAIKPTSLDKYPVISQEVTKYMY